jgi:hypothetical protein
VDLPPAFVKFTKYIYPDDYGRVSDVFVAMFDAAKKGLSDEEMAIVKSFLDRLASGEFSGQEICDIWASGKSQMRFLPATAARAIASIRAGLG